MKKKRKIVRKRKERKKRKGTKRVALKKKVK